MKPKTFKMWGIIFVVLLFGSMALYSLYLIDEWIFSGIVIGVGILALGVVPKINK